MCVRVCGQAAKAATVCASSPVPLRVHRVRSRFIDAGPRQSLQAHHAAGCTAPRRAPTGMDGSGVPQKAAPRDRPPPKSCPGKWNQLTQVLVEGLVRERMCGRWLRLWLRPAVCLSQPFEGGVGSRQGRPLGFRESGWTGSGLGRVCNAFLHNGALLSLFPRTCHASTAAAIAHTQGMRHALLTPARPVCRQWSP